MIPRKIVSADPGSVVVEAPSPGYNCALIEGVSYRILIIEVAKSSDRMFCASERWQEVP